MRSFQAPAFNFDPILSKGDKCGFCGYRNKIDAKTCVLCKRPLIDEDQMNSDAPLLKKAIPAPAVKKSVTPASGQQFPQKPVTRPGSVKTPQKTSLTIPREKVKTKIPQSGKAAFEIAFAKKMPDLNKIRTPRKKAAPVKKTSIPARPSADNHAGPMPGINPMPSDMNMTPGFSANNESHNNSGIIRTKVCTSCGRLNSEKSIFCSNCQGELVSKKDDYRGYTSKKKAWSLGGFVMALMSLGVAFSAGIALSRFL